MLRELDPSSRGFRGTQIDLALNTGAGGGGGGGLDRRSFMKLVSAGALTAALRPDKWFPTPEISLGGILGNLDIVGGHRIENVTPIVRSDGQIINTLDLSITSRDATHLNYTDDNTRRYSQITFHGITENQAKAIIGIIDINRTLKRLAEGAVKVIKGVATISVAGKVIELSEDQLKKIKEQAERAGELKGLIEGGAITGLVAGGGGLAYLFLQRALQENTLSPEVKDALTATAELQQQGSGSLPEGNSTLPSTGATVTINTETETPTVTITPSPSAIPTRTETPTVTITPRETPIPFRLSVEGAKFMEGDKQTRVTGAVCTKFVVQSSAENPYGVSLPNAKREIDALVGMGANFIIFEWNSGEEYLGNGDYVPSLIDAIKYAKSRGLRVELVLHSRGKDPNTNWKEKQINILDSRIVDDWKKLLGDERVVRELAERVDIFGVLSEAEWDTSGNRVSIYNQNLWDAAVTIRALLNKPDALCTFSIGEWGAEAQELLSVPQEIIDKIQNEKIVIEIHQYLEQNRPRDLNYLLALQAKDIPILIGETGELPWDDHETAQEYYQEVLDFIKANGLSFAWFAIDIFNTNPNDRYIHIYNGNGITDWGRKVQTAFVNYVP